MPSSGQKMPEMNSKLLGFELRSLSFQLTTKNDHWVEASRRHKVRHRVRVAENRDEQSVQHSREAEHHQQQHDGEIIAVVVRVEDESSENYNFRTLNQHNGRLCNYVSQQQL